MTEPDKARQQRLATMALADGAALAAAWDALADPPAFDVVRGPETGLVMLRGRIGGGGAPFNAGEAAMTRCVVQLADGAVGFGHVLGRDGAHAKAIALLDALAQNPARTAEVDAILAPFAEARATADAERAAEVAATRVEFFTMARGD